MIEVEAKFAVTTPDALLNRLHTLWPDLTFQDSEEVDEYFQHPVRDFRLTDEALRIRRTSDSVQLTWKGPRLDAVTKSRKELELPIAVAPAKLTHSADQLNAILQALGFTTAGVVRKTRRSTVVHFEGQAVTCCLDQVQGLPWYAELELLCAEEDRRQATELLLRLAQMLELHQSERRSYLELVQTLTRDSAATI